MTTPLDIPPRKEVKRVLRDLGMSNRQIDAFLRDGWKSLVGATAAEVEELKDMLAALNEKAKTR